MPRTSDLTPEVRKRILKAIAGGNTRTTAAAYAGITYSALRKWIQRGRRAAQGDEPFVALVAEISQKEAEAVAEAVKTVRLAGKKTWQALAWWLERKIPEEWSLDRELAAELKRFLRERSRERKKRAVAAKSA